MEIRSGLFPHMVMQRDRRDRSRQRIVGRAQAKATVSVRACYRGKALSGFAAKRLGRSDAKGRFAVELKGLPSSGPYVRYTIVDQAGRGLPAFGPLPLGTGYPKTAFGAGVQASKVVAAPGPLGELEPPAKAPRCTACPMQQWYNPVPALREGRGERLVWFRQRLRCCEAMKLDLLLGYDGPVRVWFDRQPLFLDPAGTNPIQPDERSIPVSVAAGGQELLVALGSAGGKALGIAERWGRRDLPADCPPARRILPEFR